VLGALATQQLVHPQAKITMVHGKIYTKGDKDSADISSGSIVKRPKQEKALLE